jgi:RNA polymerase sigma factor (sigma-70 family)
VNRFFGDRAVIARHFACEAARNVTDVDLLRRFVTDRDEAAFEAIVVRHGPMVFDVCRGILNGLADAEDAFQVTFLVLARRAGTVREPAALSRWLFGVAARTARKARTAAIRRRRHEIEVVVASQDQPIDPAWSEVRAIIREELARMHERHRLPLELCYLQGQTQDAAAEILGLSKTTLRRRLERARAMLRERLVRRGLGPVAILVAGTWPTATLSAPLCPALIRATSNAAVRFALDGNCGAVSATVSSLTQGVMTAMHINRLTTAFTIIALFVAVLGAGAWRYHAWAAEPPSKESLVISSTPVSNTLRSQDKPVAKPEKPTMTVALAKSGTGSCTFLDNDRILVSPGSSNGLEVRDVRTGKVVKTVTLDNHHIESFCVSGDRKWVAAVTFADTAGTFVIPSPDVTIWDAATWKVRGTIPGRRLLGMAADGRTVLVREDDGWGGEGRIEVRDLVENKMLKVAPFEFKRIDASAISPDGSLVVISGLNEIAYWKWRDGDKYDRLKVGRKVDTLVFSPDGKSVAEGPDTRMTVEVRDLVNLKVAHELSDPAQPNVPLMAAGMVFADAGKTLVFGNRVTLIESIPVPHRVLVWDVKSGKLKRQLAVESGTPLCLDVSPNGKTLAVVIENSDGLSLGAWNLSTE